MSDIRSCQNCIYNRKFYDKSDNTWYFANVCSCRISLMEGQDCESVKICGKWQEDKRHE